MITELLRPAVRLHHGRRPLACLVGQYNFLQSHPGWLVCLLEGGVGVSVVSCLGRVARVDVVVEDRELCACVGRGPVSGWNVSCFHRCEDSGW